MKLEAVDYTSATAQQDFVKSLHETGFGVLKNHPIKQELVESIYRNWQQFFLSNEKNNFAFSPEKQDGFFSTEISE